MPGAHQLSAASAWYRGATFMKFGRAAAIRCTFLGLKVFPQAPAMDGILARTLQIESPDILMTRAPDYTRRRCRSVRVINCTLAAACLHKETLARRRSDR